MTPEDLVEIELIKQLKYRYQRAVDLNLWDELAETLTEDAVAEYDDGQMQYTGRGEIVGFLKTAMGSPRIITTHMVHHPEITLLSDHQAKGRWLLQDKVVVLDFKLNVQGAAYYSDDYRKVDGHWLIARTGYKRVLEETEVRGDNLEVKKSWWETFSH